MGALVWPCPPLVSMFQEVFSPFLLFSAARARVESGGSPLFTGFLQTFWRLSAPWHLLGGKQTRGMKRTARRGNAFSVGKNGAEQAAVLLAGVGQPVTASPRFFLVACGGLQRKSTCPSCRCSLSPRYVPGSRKMLSPVAGRKDNRQRFNAPCRERYD